MNVRSDKSKFLMMGGLLLVSMVIVIEVMAFRWVNTLIAQHVILGSLAFIVGAFALISKKGGRMHQISGQWFYVLMTYSAALTLIVATQPFHISYSMFQISVMTLYFLIGGRRSLDFKRPQHSFRIDKLTAICVILVSVYVMFSSFITEGQFYPLRVVFGAIAITFGVCDLIAFNRFRNICRYWLAFHLSKMLAGYTTAVTGFFVAQNILSGYYNWFAPAAVSIVVIFYWLYKLKILSLPRLGKSQIAASTKLHIDSKGI